MRDVLRRMLWSLVAAGLTTLGVFGLFAGLRRPSGGSGAALPPLGGWREWAVLALAVLVVAGLTVAYCGWRLLRCRSIRGRRADGRLPGYVSAAVAREIERVSGVRHALVGLSGDAGRLELHARLDVGPGTGLKSLSDHFARNLDHFTLATGLMPAPVRVTVNVDGDDQRFNT